jgi:membrane protease YdiL (CAAX protease family)
MAVRSKILQKNRKALAWFVILTFASTWTVWSLFWLWDLSPALPDPYFQATAYGATLAPGIVALLLIDRMLGENWRTTTLNRLGVKRFYLWALLLPPFLVLLTVLLSVVSGVARFQLNIGALTWLSLSTLSWAPLLVIASLAEEVGWRGFLLPRLIVVGFGEWQALMATGLVWGAWHAPVILRGFNYQGHIYLGIPMMIVFCLLMGIILGWMRLASGSVLTAAAAHLSVNLTIVPLSVPFLSPGFDPTVGGQITSMIGWVPLGFFCLWLARTHRLPVSNVNR